MKHTIDIHLTKDRLPETHQLVIVEGGLACWTGSVWLSKIDDNRPIHWPVTWWSPLLHFEPEKHSVLQNIRNNIRPVSAKFRSTSCSSCNNFTLCFSVLVEDFFIKICSSCLKALADELKPPPL